ncbi:MAG: sigma-70 family RNA polymerase sigma factor [Myxococcales bacterium]|nr:sigma-70 family RNA polymerase sigma factor [Myxococcales bacterium]
MPALASLVPSIDRDLPDGLLLEAVLTKDQTAWSEFLRRFRSLIFRCITKVSGKYDAVLSNEDVNEIFGDVCINILRDDMRKLRVYDPARGSKLGSWLGLLAINTAYDYLRATCRRPMLDKLDGAQDRPGCEPSALDTLLDKERWSYLNALMSDFSDRDRRFVELYYGQGMLPEEVAVAMRISVKTVYSKKNKLRIKLEALAGQDPLRPSRSDEPTPPPVRLLRVAA